MELIGLPAGRRGRDRHRQDTALTIRNILASPAIRRAIDAAVGAVLVGLGLRLATERR